MDARLYTYRVFWSEEDREFVGLCTGFPGLSWLAEDQEVAFTGIVALVQDCIDDLMSNGEPIPTPLLKKQRF